MGIGVEYLMEPCVAQYAPGLLPEMAEFSLTSFSWGVVEKKVGWVVSAYQVQESAFGLPLKPGEVVLFFSNEERGRGLVGCLFGSPCEVVRGGVMEVA